MKNQNEINCPFCKFETGTEFLFETDYGFAIYDKYPVNPGHTLIIPKRHCADYFNLDKSEQESLWDLVNNCKDHLEKSLNPDGFNIGINVGESAGQSIFHVHIHLIPRYKGDASHPKGGIRGVIPGKQKY